MGRNVGVYGWFLNTERLNTYTDALYGIIATIMAVPLSKVTEESRERVARGDLTVTELLDEKKTTVLACVWVCLSE